MQGVHSVYIDIHVNIHLWLSWISLVKVERPVQESRVTVHHVREAVRLYPVGR